MNTLLGQRLGGKYELQAELGRGGMGIVYRAHDTMLHRTVAVKVLTPQLAADPTFVERFRHEAIAAANLRHPHIATVYDVGQDLVQGDTVHYLVMEFIEGQTLDRVLQRQGQPFSLQQTDQIIRYVVFDDGGFSRFIFPSADPPEFACAEAAQLGRPRRGFSTVWCENPDVRQRIGNALDDEIGNDRPLQIFEQGFMVFIPERNAIYALLDNGSWQRFE